jgi:hypothetical protein
VTRVILKKDFSVRVPERPSIVINIVKIENFVNRRIIRKEFKRGRGF